MPASPRFPTRPAREREVLVSPPFSRALEAGAVRLLSKIIKSKSKLIYLIIKKEEAVRVPLRENGYGNKKKKRELKTEKIKLIKQRINTL